jgi:hypothetical protein
MQPFFTLAPTFRRARCSARAILVALIALAAPAYAQTEPMRPGMWEVVVSNETPGVDGKLSTTSRTCYGAADLKVIQSVLPRQSDFGAKCTMKDYKFADKTASWVLNCTTKSGGSLTGPSTITLNGTDYAGSAQLVSKEGAKTKKVNQTLVGKRVGDCK